MLCNIGEKSLGLDSDRAAWVTLESSIGSWASGSGIELIPSGNEGTDLEPCREKKMARSPGKGYTLFIPDVGGFRPGLKPLTQIIKALLHNRKVADLGPIICVYYTNNALDQLLEHLV
jgi:hypothetical protein